MAHIQKRERGGKVRWIARIQTPDGRSERTRTFERKAHAEAWVAEQEAAKHAGSWVDPARGKTRLRNYAEDWLAGKVGLAPKTHHDYRSLLDTWALPVFGDASLAAIEAREVRRWVRSMVDAGLSASRTRKAAGLLSAILKTAVADGYLGRNPAAHVQAPTVRAPERLFLTAEQVRALAGEHPCPALVYVLGYGGLRWSEAVALRRKRVELLRRRLHVVEATTETGAKLHWKDVKNHERRTVALPAFVCNELATHLESAPEDPDALVFTSPLGEPMAYRNEMRRRWKPAAARAGLPEAATPHVLRHTAGALLIAQGADLKRVQAHLGHKTIAMTAEVYGHLYDDALDDVMEELDAAHRDAETRPRRDRDGTGVVDFAPRRRKNAG